MPSPWSPRRGRRRGADGGTDDRRRSDGRSVVLPRVIDAPEGKPIRPEAPDNQRLMSEIPRDPSTWTSGLASVTSDVIDARSSTWADERGGTAPRPSSTHSIEGTPHGAAGAWRSAPGRGS